MKEIRLGLTKEELTKFIGITGDFKDVVLVQECVDTITHRKNQSEFCTVKLEVFGIKAENVTAKYGMAKVCPCGTLFIHTDLQEAK